MIFSNLNYLINKNNVSQKSIIDKTGITRPTLIQLIRNDTSGIKFDTIDKLCNFFGVSIEELLIKSSNEIQFIGSRIDFDKNIVIQTQGEVEAFTITATFKINEKEFVFKGDHVYSTLGDTLEFVNNDEINMICSIDVNEYEKLNSNDDFEKVFQLYIYNFNIIEKIASNVGLNDIYKDKLNFTFKLEEEHEEEDLFDDFVNSLTDEQKNKLRKLLD